MTVHRIDSIALAVVGIAALCFDVTPVNCHAEAPGPPQAAELAGEPAESLEVVVARLEKALGADTTVLPRGGPRELAEVLKRGRGGAFPYYVLRASPDDKVGRSPAGLGGAAVTEIVATDGRYTLVTLPGRYDPELADRICAALGMTRSKLAEQRRVEEFASYNWLDFRLAVVVDSGRPNASPRPLAHGPTPDEIDSYTKLFTDKGPNAAPNRGDPYHWFVISDTCDLLPGLVTKDEGDIAGLKTFANGGHGTSYLLLSHKPDEVLLSNPRMSTTGRPRPWHLKAVHTVKDTQGQPAIELELDDLAMARIAKLKESNPGAALAVLFGPLGQPVLQIQTIDSVVRGKLVISSKSFDEKLVERLAKSLRESMVPSDVDLILSKQFPADDMPPPMNTMDSIRAFDAIPAEERAVGHALSAIDRDVVSIKLLKRHDTFILLYRPQAFKVHGRTMTGEVDIEAHDDVGPSYDGLVVKAYLQPRGNVNQAVTPQTIREPYWQTDLDVTPIGDSEKQVYWALSYGSRTDKGLLDKVRKQMKALEDKEALDKIRQNIK